VTNPGELEKVPIKVVPIYIEPVLEEYVDPEPPEVVDEPEQPPARSGLVGQIALTVAILTVVAHVVAVATASAGAWATGTAFGYVAIGLSVLAVCGGIVAIILKRGRGVGIAAIVIGVLANPWIVLVVLRFFA
jgi:hypothetical protein